MHLKLNAICKSKTVHIWPANEEKHDTDRKNKTSEGRGECLLLVNCMQTVYLEVLLCKMTSPCFL